MLLGRDVMFSYPQYLDFAYNDKTSETCQFLLGMLQRKSEVLYLHSRQVANYSIATAAKLGLSARELGLIHTAALMHDIGLLSVPNSILNKFPYLSVREMAQYKRHCVAGCSMLENMEEFSGIVDLIKDHHERWDGTGYPKRLKGVNIPLGARIIAVADYYDGIVNSCTQNWEKSPEEAAVALMDGIGTRFDPVVVKAFVQTLLPGKQIRVVPRDRMPRPADTIRRIPTAAQKMAGERPAKSRVLEPEP